MKSLPFRPQQEIEELRAYLGDSYDPTLAPRFLDLVDEELEQVGDEARLYRTSQAYLYNLTLFAISGTKLPYMRALTSLVPPPARLLDYGCGIGSDGLMLLEAGYEVHFADFRNPSVEYLRWRLRRRGLEAPIYDVERDHLPRGLDAAYAFDVVEHLDDPLATLTALESAASLVCVNLLESEPGDSKLHHELPIATIKRHAVMAGLRRYRLLHRGVAHLLIYRGGPPSPRPPVASLLRLLAGSSLSPFLRRLGLDRPRRGEAAAIAAVSQRLASEAGLRPTLGPR